MHLTGNNSTEKIIVNNHVGCGHEAGIWNSIAVTTSVGGHQRPWACGPAKQHYKSDLRRQTQAIPNFRSVTVLFIPCRNSINNMIVQTTK